MKNIIISAFLAATILPGCSKQQCEENGTGTLTIYNSYGVPASVYLDGKFFMTVDPGEWGTKEVETGEYQLNATETSGTYNWNFPVDVNECRQSKYILPV